MCVLLSTARILRVFVEKTDVKRCRKLKSPSWKTSLAEKFANVCLSQIVGWMSWKIVVSLWFRLLSAKMIRICTCLFVNPSFFETEIQCEIRPGYLYSITHSNHAHLAFSTTPIYQANNYYENSNIWKVPPTQKNENLINRDPLFLPHAKTPQNPRRQYLAFITRI